MAAVPGLSPLTRGNPKLAATLRSNAGPIPAHAGQPAARSCTTSTPRAYPRSRGATMPATWPSLSALGLSPLTRGNHDLGAHADAADGPIPAHAGQPCCSSAKTTPKWAYPRSRGATQRALVRQVSTEGLSPLTRGNPGRHHQLRHRPGPIPAHAGQPKPRSRPPCSRRAYPRSRGATTSSPASSSGWAGLSPLTRGNPGRCASLRRSAGPIPAHAGQPCRRRIPSRRSWAYPRSRGATSRLNYTNKTKLGLSPLTRGNQREQQAMTLITGPIPAHAGQPLQAWRAAGVAGAYPRSRGATLRTARIATLPAGLSPLTRGNPPAAHILADPVGPIPAHAGQPTYLANMQTAVKAYPRSRGATSCAQVLVAQEKTSKHVRDFKELWRTCVAGA